MVTALRKPKCMRVDWINPNGDLIAVLESSTGAIGIWWS